MRRHTRTAGYLFSTVLAIATPATADSDAGGNMAATNVLLSRSGDGSFPANPTAFAGGTKPGEWRRRRSTTS